MGYDIEMINKKLYINSMVTSESHASIGLGNIAIVNITLKIIFKLQNRFYCSFLLQRR